MDENERPIEMPQTIGRYQVLESVGYGAMGAVYKAFDPLIKRTLAIKTIRLDIPRQSPQYKSFIDRFYHEARISGTLSHPNIVTLFDIGEENGLPYLAMEFVEGETISGLLEQGTRFKPEKVIGLVSQIASAVDYAHSKGVIHRDIKPSNLILYDSDKVKVTDFGIAKLIDAEMTQSGTLLGTPSYMSPEQAMGEKLDGRSDIFSLGVCAFEMLSGEQPFPGNNVTSILYKLVHVDPVQPTDLEMHGLVPQKWHEVFNKALAKKPDERYQTATEFVQDLEYCLGSWFGAVPDLTLSEGSDSAIAAKVKAAVSTPPAARKTGSRPAPAVEEKRDEAAEPIEMTVAMPSPAAQAERGREARAAAKAPAPQEAPPTVYMSAPAAGTPAPPPAQPPAEPAAEMEGTVVMASPVSGAQPTRPAPPQPPAPAPASPSPDVEGTVLMPSPVAAPSTAPPPAPRPQPPEMEGTVVMPSPTRAASPPAEVEGTVVMPSPTRAAAPPAEVEGTVLMPSPTRAASPPAEVEGTVLMRSPVASPGPAAPSSPPPAPPHRPMGVYESPSAAGAMEGTVVMESPTRGAAAPPARVAPPVPPPSVPAPPAAAAPAAPSEPFRTEPVPAAAEAAPTRRGPPVALLAGIGGLALLVGASLLGFMMLRKSSATDDQPSPPPTTVAVTAPSMPATPPPVIEGSLRITSQPSGATVTVDGVVRGVTPVDVPGLAMGSHEVKVEQKGYAETVETVALTPDAPGTELKLVLSRTAPPMGSVEFVSNPPGALVKVNGTAVGTTPIRSHRMKLGSHQVEMQAEGFEPFTGSVTVREGRKARVDAFLRAIPKATPTPSPTPEVVDPNRIYAHTEVDTPPRKVSGSSPGYPPDAPKLRSGDSVSVAGLLVVTETGEVADVKITESGGSVLDQTVSAAVRGWKFTPGVKKGIKVKVRVPFRQTFRAG